MGSQEYVNICFTESRRAQDSCTKCVTYQILKTLRDPDIMVIREDKFRDYLKRKFFPILSYTTVSFS